MSQLKTAPVNMFTTLRPRLYVGQLLQDIKSVQASILRFGLLSPIIISRSEGRLVVLDGRKRLAAIRRLDFMGRLPRSLVNIPYIEVEHARETISDAPQLLSRASHRGLGGYSLTGQSISRAPKPMRPYQILSYKSVA